MALVFGVCKEEMMSCVIFTFLKTLLSHLLRLFARPVDAITTATLNTLIGHIETRHLTTEIDVRRCSTDCSRSVFQKMREKEEKNHHKLANKSAQSKSGCFFSIYLGYLYSQFQFSPVQSEPCTAQCAVKQ